jgi:hypothetical protein
VFLFSISYVRRGLFHGDNMGSNPIGDANKIKDLENNSLKGWRPIAPECQPLLRQLVELLCFVKNLDGAHFRVVRVG